MKTPEDRCCLFIEEIVDRINIDHFPDSRFDCERRRGSYECCAPSIDVRIYDNTCENKHRFHPIAIVSIIDTDQPFFRIKIRSSESIADSKKEEKNPGLIDFKCELEDVENQLKQKMLRNFIEKEKSEWLYIIEEPSRSRKISDSN